MAAMRVDWFFIVTELNRMGFSTRDIAYHIDRSHSTVLYWKAGGDPTHADGEALLAFWSAASGRSREDVPRVPREVSAADACR